MGTDQTGETLRTSAARKDADTNFRQSDLLDRAGGNSKRTAQRNLESPAHADSVNRRNDRYRRPFAESCQPDKRGGKEILGADALRRHGLTGTHDLRDICVPNEYSGASAGDHQRPN